MSGPAARPEITGRALVAGQISLADQIIASLLARLDPLELLRVASMQEAAHLSSLSVDQLNREHRDKVVSLSKRRNGMRVCHALMLPELDTS